MKIIDCVQGTDEWKQARAGRVTGSKASCMFMGKETAGRNDYILQLALERLTGQIDDGGYVSAEMQRGTELEAYARMQTEARLGKFIRETGFVSHDDLMVGVSLDGDSDDFDCIYEFKCPKSTTHLGYIDAGVLPKTYKYQVMHELYVSKSKQCVFVSFDDRMPEGLQLFMVDAYAKDLELEEYEKTLLKFLGEVELKVNHILELQAKGMKNV